MGQQQLLLIVLGIVMTTIAIGFSNQIFDASSEEANTDCVSSELFNLGMLAQQFYNRPKQLGGGSLSYKGWKIPSGLDSTLSGTYEILNIDYQKIVLAGFPHSATHYVWFFECAISKNEINSWIIF